MMLDFLLFILISFTSLSTLFVSYILVMMAIKRWNRSKDITWDSPVLLIILVAIFMVFDILVNLLVVSIWALDIPREWTVTARLKRWRTFKDKGFYNLSWLQKKKLLLATYLCEEELDVRDVITGDHC